MSVIGMLVRMAQSVALIERFRAIKACPKIAYKNAYRLGFKLREYHRPMTCLAEMWPLVQRNRYS